MNKNNFITLVGTMRPPFLVLTVSVVCLGAALASYQGFEWSLGLFLLVLIGALSAHIAVNMLNEYEDYKSGLDSMTQRTPFSGGSGSLQSNESASQQVFNVGWAFIGIVVILGLYFIYLRGWALIPLGIIGLLVIALYTPKITKSPWLCLIAPGLAFGPLMVMGTYFVLTGEYNWLVLTISLVPFFLVNNLLLLNQFPDLDADKQVGRLNLLMLLGTQKSALIFNIFLLSSYAIIILMVVFGYLPAWALLGLLTFIVAIPLLQKVIAHHNDLEKLLPVLGLNVLINILTPLLIAIGLWIA